MNVLHDRDGPRYVLKDRAVTLDELTAILRPFADRRRDSDHPAHPSEVVALIRADRLLPWGAVRAVLDVCRHPDIRIYRIQFAVRVR